MSPHCTMSSLTHTLFPYTTLFRSSTDPDDDFQPLQVSMVAQSGTRFPDGIDGVTIGCSDTLVTIDTVPIETADREDHRSEEHTPELQSRGHLVCGLLVEKKKTKKS